MSFSFTVHRDGTIVKIHNSFADVQPETRTTYTSVLKYDECICEVNCCKCLLIFVGKYARFQVKVMDLKVTYTNKPTNYYKKNPLVLSIYHVLGCVVRVMDQIDL